MTPSPLQEPQSSPVLAETSAAQGTVRIKFEGRTVEAKSGQTIAAALQKTGVRTLSRSVKYHTPRGYTCGFGACGDCPLTVNGTPGTLSCVTPVEPNQVIKRELGFPTAGFDVLRTASFMRPWLGAGFQFKLFTKQPRLSSLAGKFLAILAGGGRMPTPAASAAAKVTAVEHISPQVAVVGAGVSGLAAALAAAATGVTVTVIDRDFLGGRSGVRTEPVTDNGTSVHLGTEFLRLLDKARRDPLIQILPGIAVGFIDGLLPVVAGTTRYEVRPQSVIIATGSYETPVLIPQHDRPGVMLGDAALKLAEVEGVSPGKSAVVIEADPRAGEIAQRLRDAGVAVREVCPADTVEEIFGWSRARGVILRGASGQRRRIRADLIVVAGQRRPAEELALHLAYAEAGTHEQVTSDRFTLADSHIRVGSAAGSATYDLEQVRAEAVSLAQKLTPPSTTK